jgi:hypothetical protein
VAYSQTNDEVKTSVSSSGQAGASVVAVIGGPPHAA